MRLVYRCEDGHKFERPGSGMEVEGNTYQRHCPVCIDHVECTVVSMG